MEMKYVNGEYRVLMGMSIVVLNSYQHDVVSSSECRSMLIYFHVDCSISGVLVHGNCFFKMLKNASAVWE